MNRQQRRIAHGGVSGAVAFVAGWAVVAFMTPFNAIPQIGRWDMTLWVWLGANFVDAVEFSRVGFATGYINPVRLAGVTRRVHIVAVLASGGAGAYTAYEHASHRTKYTVRNALNAGAGYVTLGLLAMIVSDINPPLTLFLIIGFVIMVSIWVGSTVLNVLIGGFPFLGLVSLGTVVALGLFVIFGSVAVLASIYGLLVMAFVPAATGGFFVGFMEYAERSGPRHSGKAGGLAHFVSEYWKVILLVIALAALLYIGVTGAIRPTTYRL